MIRKDLGRRLTLTTVTALVLSLVAAVGAQAYVAVGSGTAPTELFFSEYVEGTSFNKAVEIYNGTGAPVDLAAGGYDVQLYSNGSATATSTQALTGTIAPGDVFVVAHPSASFAASADMTSTTINFNGDDAFVLRKNGTIIDVIGQIGFDPGTEWGTGLTSTADNTLRRKPSVQSGDANGTDAFDPAVEWDGYAVDTFDGLGSHTIDDAGPTVTSSTPANGDTGFVRTANLTVTFGEPVTVSSSSFTLTCASSGTHTLTVTGGPTTYTLDPASDLSYAEECELTAVAANVSDVDTDDPPDTMAANYTAIFTTESLVDDAPTVASTNPANGASSVAASANVTITFSEPVNAPTSAFSISCSVSGTHAFALSGGPTTFTLNPTGDFFEDERCTVTVTATAVTDQDTNDPPDTMAVDHVFAFDTIATIPIGTVQGPISDTTDGATHRSPYAPPPTNPANPCGTSAAGQTVTVQGLIYQRTLARTSAGANQHGFFIQNTAETRDADPTTSDGIFVFMGSFTSLIGGYTPTVGDEVVLSARVTEFNCLTQLTSASLVRVVRSGVAVDVELPPFEAFPPDYVDDANRYWERLEGMRGRAPVGSITVGRRQVFGPATTMDGEDAFIAPTHPVALRANEYARRTYRDPHPMDNRPELWDDGNGFRIILGSMGVKAAENDNTALIAPARTYDRLAVSPPGGLYFSFQKYIIHPERQITLTTGPDPYLNAPPTAPVRPQEYSIADYNVENLYDYRDDPFDGCDFAGNPGCPGVNPPFDYVPSSQIEYEMRLRDIATQIIQDLHSPEIIMTQEGEDQDICIVTGGTMNCGTQNNADGKPDSLQELALVVRSQGGPVYETAYDRNGADARGIVSAFMYRTDRVELLPATAGHPVLGASPTVSYRGTPLAYNTDVQNPKVLNAVLPADVDRSTGTDGNNVFTRPPQVGLFRIWEQAGRSGNSFQVYGISNHFSSGPDRRVGQRREQARYNAAIAAAIQASEPGARIDIAGDFNTFPRPDDPFPPGHPLHPSDQLAPLYDAGFVNLWDVVAAEAPASAYSYVFDMQAQTLDMHFVSPTLRAELRQFRYAHVNADYPTEFDSPGARGISDHDPGVARFAAPAALAGVGITKTASSDRAAEGAIVSYTLTVTNVGPSTAMNVTVSDPLPAGLAFVAATPTQGTCTGGQTLSCSLGTLASGATARVVVDARATRAGEVTNVAEVAAATNDPNTGDNRASATTTVEAAPPPPPPPDTRCRVDVGPKTLRAGRAAIVRVTVRMVATREPAGDTVVRLRGAGVAKTARTSSGGTVRFIVRPRRVGAIRVTAAPQLTACSARIAVRRAPRPTPPPQLTGRS